MRCFSCGGVVADKIEELDTRVANGDDPAEVLTELGVTRYCCRRMLLSNANVIDQVVKYHERLSHKRSEFDRESI